MAQSLTVYITAQTIHRSLREPEGRETAAGLLRKSRCSHVVLEGYRSGLIIAENILRNVADHFRAVGFEVTGGFTPTCGGDYGKPSAGIETRQDLFCYTSESTVIFIEAELRKLARLFDDVLITDAFETSCRCEECDDLRMDRDWGVFRRDRLCSVARRFRAAIQSENRNARLLIKFPQYYDRSHRFGYDSALFPKIFDAVWVGAETRNPQSPDFGYTEPYQGYFNATWPRSWADGSFESVWIDHLDCNAQNLYDQVMATALAGAPRLTFFNYEADIINTSRIRRTTDALPHFDEIAALAKNPTGVHVIKPPNSDGRNDLFIYDYLGMIGIPSIPACEISDAMPSVIVPAQAMSDPRTPEAIRSALNSGSQVILTFGALNGLRGRPDILEYFGYSPSGIAANGAAVTAFETDSKQYVCDEHFALAGDLAPHDANVLSWGLIDARLNQTWRIPFITSRNLSSGGRAVVWNMETFGHDAFPLYEPFNVPVQSQWFGLPFQVLHTLRRIATKPLGFSMHLPARVAAFVFEQHCVFVNYTLNRADVRITGIDWDRDSLRSDSSSTVVSADTILLAPQSHAVVRRRIDHE